MIWGVSIGTSLPVPPLGRGNLKLIAHAPDRLNIAWIAGVAFNLLAERADMHIDRAPITQIVITPNPAQEYLAGKDAIWRARHQDQQIELLGGQVYCMFLHFHAPRRNRHRQPRIAQSFARRAVRAISWLARCIARRRTPQDRD